MTDPDPVPFMDQTGSGVQPLPRRTLVDVTADLCFYCDLPIQGGGRYHRECYLEMVEDEQRNEMETAREVLGER